jgi:hypothetical protein
LTPVLKVQAVDLVRKFEHLAIRFQDFSNAVPRFCRDHMRNIAADQTCSGKFKVEFFKFQDVLVLPIEPVLITGIAILFQ